MQKIASPQELQTALLTILAYCQGPEEVRRDKVATDLRELAERLAGSAYDQLVKDKNHLPKKLGQFYSKELKKRIGRGTKVDVTKAETTMPRGWDYGNHTVLKITLPDGNSLNASITLNVANNEASGNFTVDYNYGGVIGLGRARTAEQALTMMVSDAGDHLKAAGAKT